MKTEMSPLRRAKAMMGSIPIFAQQLCEGAKCNVAFNYGATTAYTDGVTVTMPALPIPSSDEEVHIAEQLADLVMCYIPHEVGHIRYSCFEVIKDADSPLLMSLLNAIEDPRMELDMISKFPGARGQLDRGLERLAAMGHFDDLTASDSPAQLVSIYTLYYLRGHLRLSDEFIGRAERSRDAVVEVFGERFVERLEILLDSDGTCMLGTKDALKLSKEIVKAIQEEKDRAKAEQPSPSQPQDDTAGEGAEEESSSGDDAADSNQSGSGDSDSVDDSTSDQAGETDGNEGASNGNGDGTGPSSDGTSDTETPFDQALNSSEVACKDLGDLMAGALEAAKHEASENFQSDDLICTSVGDGKDPAPSPIIPGFNPDAAITASRRLKTRLRSLMQTMTLSRANESVRGSRINSRKAFRSSNYNRRMFIHQDDNKGVETAVFLLCDRSGSMDHIMVPTRDSVYAIADAMSSVTGVKIGAGLFPSNSILFPIGHKVSNYVDRMNFYPGGSTPLGEGMTMALSQLFKRREPRKIMVVVTDGEPDSLPYAKAMVATAEERGVEVFAVGIVSTAVNDVFDKCCVIQSVEELPEAVLGMLTGALTNQKLKLAA